MDYNGQIDLLFNDQMAEWELARVNYAVLQHMRIRQVIFDGFEIHLQFNPGRILSSAAKVDPQSISTRPCFLCEENRPAEQRGIRYKDDYLLLLNPYPVFSRHLTIASRRHRPQLILPEFITMLKLTRDLSDYTVFYNGPQCGASAPDHFHFQAVQKGAMPIEADFSKGNKCIRQGEHNGTVLYTWNNYLRQIITCQGTSIHSLMSVFHSIYNILVNFLPNENEPMINILSSFEKDSYIVHILPRKLHRPDRFFANDAGQLLLSPASIDLGGVLIMPREEDFQKITGADIQDVFRQVCAEEELIRYITDHLIQHP